MVKFGSYTLPHVLTIRETYSRIRQEVPLPGRSWAYRKDRGGLGGQITLSGEIRADVEQTRDEIAALADGVARILDYESPDLIALEATLRYQAGPIWTDDTAEAKTPAGTPFTLLGANTDFFYFAHRERFNKLQFDLEILGSYGARTWEYSNGVGGWNVLSIGTDGTNGFSQDGTVAFSPPSGWHPDTVNEVANKFWVRVSVASVTTPASVNQILMNKVFNCIMLDPTFPQAVELYKRLPYSLIFLQQENPT